MLVIVRYTMAVSAAGFIAMDNAALVYCSWVIAMLVAGRAMRATTQWGFCRTQAMIVLSNFCDDCSKDVLAFDSANG
jgi:hypothetical protein